MPYTAYIVDGCRTAGGKKNGALSEWHPADLGAAVIDELVKRTGIKVWLYLLECRCCCPFDFVCDVDPLGFNSGLPARR